MGVTNGRGCEVLADQPVTLRHPNASSRRLEAECRFVEALLKEEATDQAEKLQRYRAWHEAQARDHGVDPDLLEAHCTDLHYEANLTGVGLWLRRRDG